MLECIRAGSIAECAWSETDSFVDWEELRRELGEDVVTDVIEDQFNPIVSFSICFISVLA